MSVQIETLKHPHVFEFPASSSPLTLPSPHVQTSVQKAPDRDPESLCRNRSWSAWPWHLDISIGHTAIQRSSRCRSLILITEKDSSFIISSYLHNWWFQSYPNTWAIRNHKSVAFSGGNQWSLELIPVTVWDIGFSLLCAPDVWHIHDLAGWETKMPWNSWKLIVLQYVLLGISAFKNRFLRSVFFPKSASKRRSFYLKNWHIVFVIAYIEPPASSETSQKI